jgi:predicted RNase H-like nuclease (RuvC/YqgF family)
MPAINTCVNTQNGGNILVYKNADSEGIKGSELFLKSYKSNKSPKSIIVGFDPGLTVGIAILNLKGQLISIASFKEIRRSDIISHIIGYGSTILVATDVYPPPKTVRKLASTLNSKIWSPYKNMTVESKIEIVDSFLNDGKSLLIPQNAHERDALAAAVKTYRDHLNKFRQIERRAEKLDLPDDIVENVKIMVINGKSITNAIKELTENKTAITGIDSNNIEDEKISQDKSGLINNSSKINSSNIPTTLHKREDLTEEELEWLHREEATITKLKNKLISQKRYSANLKEKNKILKNDVKSYKTEVSKLQKKIDKLRKDYSKKILEKKEFTSKIAMIKRLQEKYNKEKALRLDLEMQLSSNNEMADISDDYVPVKIIELFTREGIREASEFRKIMNDDVVLLKSSEGGGSNTASMICDMGVSAVITVDKISDPAENIFIKNMIPIIPIDSVKINYSDEIAYINSEELNKEIKSWKEKINIQKKTENNKKLINLVDEYRAQRKRL